MPVKHDASGRRFIELEFELPGTPEQVWQAIATGPGISSWFVPSEVDERTGGAIIFHLDADMTSSGHVTAWQPHECFAYEERDWMGDAPPLASEFIIQARSGSTCTVRLVHSLFTSDEQWDDQLESMESGWPPFFEVLRLYLTHFPGARSASVRATGHYRGSDSEAWEAVTQALGLADPHIGERRNASANGAPSLAGTIERLSLDARHREVMLRIDTPTTGIALIGVGTWGGQVHVAISLFFYGDDAAALAKQEEPRWQAWTSEHFPRIEPADSTAK